MTMNNNRTIYFTLLYVTVLVGGRVQADFYTTPIPSERCANYLSFTKSSDIVRITFLHWRHGYLYALNAQNIQDGTLAGYPDKVRIPGSVDISDYELADKWINAYCADHPEDVYVLAIKLFWVALRAQQGLPIDSRFGNMPVLNY